MAAAQFLFSDFGPVSFPDFLLFITLLVRARKVPLGRMPWLRALRDIARQPEVVRVAAEMTERAVCAEKTDTKPSTSAVAADHHSDDCDEFINNLDVVSLDGGDDGDANTGKVTRWAL